MLALSKELADMVKHIYGNINVMKYEDRPNMFIKELKLYIDYLKNEIFEYSDSFSSSQIKKWNSFKNNLSGGIQYYMDLFGTISYFKIDELKILQQIKQFQYELNEIKIPEPVIA